MGEKMEYSTDESFDVKVFKSLLFPQSSDDIEEQILSPLSCLREFESKWLLEFDLPLVDKKNIEVSVGDNNTISIEAKLKESYVDKSLDFHNEFQYFKKSVTLPGRIDEKNISANFSNGRLTINIPKFFQGSKIKIE